MLTESGPDSPIAGAGLYWRIEKQIRTWEGMTGSVVGATGAFYAVRRELVVPLPQEAVLDDVYIPMHVVRQGRRVVFEPAARAWDTVSSSSQQEFRRKVRTLSGNYQLLQIAPWMFSFSNPVLFRFVSHKLLRLVMPFALATALVSSLFAGGWWVYRAAAAAQVLFYATAVLRATAPRLKPTGRLGDAAFAFVVLNGAALMAFVNFVRGQKPVWVR